MPFHSFDNLVLTAAGKEQAAGFERELRLREEIGWLEGIAQWHVVPDPEGRRIGSGGSTLYSVAEVIRACRTRSNSETDLAAIFRNDFAGRRVLIIHSGGDSRRLPACGVSGKCFLPLPASGDGPLPRTLFDRLLFQMVQFPRPRNVAGEVSGGGVLVASGDVWLDFASSDVLFQQEGVTGMACPAPPELARHHGVYLRGPDGSVRQFLQKPSPARQEQSHAVSVDGKSLLDVGVVHFSPCVVERLLTTFGGQLDGNELCWTTALGAAMNGYGLDLYRELLCAWGEKTTCERYIEETFSAGTPWPRNLLRELFEAIDGEPFHVVVPAKVAFRHLGTSRQLIEEGAALVEPLAGVGLCSESGIGTGVAVVSSLIGNGGSVSGAPSWIEGCEIQASLCLAGENLVAGTDITQPVQLSRGECVDVIPARSRSGGDVLIVRCYKTDDLFLGRPDRSQSFCNLPLMTWLQAVGALESDVWEGVAASDRSDWTARLFPAIDRQEEWMSWLWMLNPEKATESDLSRWRSADRYSLSEISRFADRAAFCVRRLRLRSRSLLDSPPGPFHSAGEISAEELGLALAHYPDSGMAMTRILKQSTTFAAHAKNPSMLFSEPRALHSLGTAFDRLAERAPGLRDTANAWWADFGAPTLAHALPRDVPIEDSISRQSPGPMLRRVALQMSRRTILGSVPSPLPLRHASNRTGRFTCTAPVRMDLCGGWTDTPPYALENGGCVINAAIDLECRPPIRVTVKPLDEHVLRILSIDQNERVEIREPGELTRWNDDPSSAALVRAAVAQMMFRASDPADDIMPQRGSPALFEFLGGGLEVTTSAAVPLGSGLGTSSILGAAVLAALHHTLGWHPTHAELHRETLRLEQSLTTGGGWQDQVGGVERGVKQITAAPGLVPEFDLVPLPDDLISPEKNGGRTLLYYTGLTRLAKNILERIVGRYLDRHRPTMAALRAIARLPAGMKSAMESSDIESFGRLIGEAWRLNRQLDPESSTPEIDHLLDRIAPHLLAAKLAGAGGGGFLFLVCRTPESAAAVRKVLNDAPLNPQARFFDYQINRTGLVVGTS